MDMKIRITDDGNQSDIDDIHAMLKEYNLSHREASKNGPIGIFYEDENNKKLAGLTGETFGNWLCILLHKRISLELDIYLLLLLIVLMGEEKI